jgi:DnaJ-class molecular chaperone
MKVNYYQVLNIDNTVSLDELKVAYRKLSLKFHPDVNSAADATSSFLRINEAYEYLIKHHVPVPKPPQPIDTSNCEKYFRMLDGNLIKLPEHTLSKDSVIFCMTNGGREIRISLPKGTQLPKTIKIRNMGQMEVRIVADINIV